MTSKPPSPTLVGKRISLRPVNPEKDFKAFFSLFQEPEMHLWTGNTIPVNPDESYQELQKYRDLEGIMAWTIVLNDNGEMIGTYWIAPVLDSGNRRVTAEAQRIGKPYWRKGYTKEARKLVYDFAFFDLGVDEIHAQAWKGNVNSCYSMEHAGFQLTGAVERLFSKRNEQHIEHHYRLTKKDWENRRLDI